MGFLQFYVTLAPVDLSSLVNLKKRRRNCKMCLKKTATSMDEEELFSLCPHKEQKGLVEYAVCKHVDTTLNFPFLTDRKTIRHITKGHIVFIVRGLPGSGKSTIAKNIQKVYPNSVTCSADDHFLVNGTYVFDASGLKDAHAECQREARQSCKSGIPVVIIDNTHVRRWEMKFYFDLARRTNYTAVVVGTRTSWRFNPEELAKRNKHGVEEDILRMKVSQYETLSPVYYGWFLTGNGSKDVTFIAQILFKECLKSCCDYYQSLRENLKSSDTTRNDDSKHVTDEARVTNYFKWNVSPDILHCTAKFCNKGRALGAHEYLHRTDVEEAVGKASDLQIVGFIFSQDTIGARLQLSEEQLSMFDKPEEKERDEILARNAAVESRQAQMKRMYKARSFVRDDRPVESVVNSVHLCSGSSSSFSHVTIPPPQGFGRTAHITIALAERVKPSQTIYDVLDVCDLEYHTNPGVRFVPVTGGQAAYLGNGFCTVYLYKAVTVSSLFSAYNV